MPLKHQAMTATHYQNSIGLVLEADATGHEDDPLVLLLHGAGQDRSLWADVVIALEQAGRRAINLSLSGEGGFADTAIADLRMVLAQLGARPIVVAAGSAGPVAMAALGGADAHLAAGLVLVDISDVVGVGVVDALPVLMLNGALDHAQSDDALAACARVLPEAEIVEIDEHICSDRAEAFNALLLDFLERKQPRAAPEYRAGSDARTLRDAMGCFATGVTVVTAMSADGQPVGLTANSFTSVSLDPPLLLVCIANGAGSAPVLRQASHFAINVLQIGQQPASNRFAGKGEDRFANTPWAPGETGAPVLTGSLSTFECSRHAVHDGGDHFILIGKVVRANFEPRRDPLLYFRGKYRRLHFA